MDKNSSRSSSDGVRAAVKSGATAAWHHAPPAKLSVLMPVYNERWTLREIINRVLASPVPLELEVVAVDDGSTDGSWEILQELAAREPRLLAIRHAHNGGKGTAIRTAIAHMTGEVAIVQDADLEYDPDEYPALVAPILADKADAVFGSRYAGASRKVLFFWHSAVNRFLTLMSNLLTGLDLTDMETCYKMVRADVLRELRLSSRTFTFEPEITSRLAQWGARIYEVPIRYEGRSFQEGKKIRPIDGLKAIGELLRCRFLDPHFTRHAGFARLKSIDRARRRQRRIFEQIRGFVGARVLEAGAGIGSLSGFLFERELVVLVEHDPVCASFLAHRFARRDNVALEHGSLANFDDCRHWQAQAIDTVLVADWRAAAITPRESLAAAAAVLTPAGHLVWILPAEIAAQAASGATELSPEQAMRVHLEAVGLEVVFVKKLGRLMALREYVDAAAGTSSARPVIAAGRASLRRSLAWIEQRLGGTDSALIVVGKKPAALEQRLAA